MLARASGELASIIHLGDGASRCERLISSMNCLHASVCSSRLDGPCSASRQIG